MKDTRSLILLGLLLSLTTFSCSANGSQDSERPAQSPVNEPPAGNVQTARNEQATDDSRTAEGLQMMDISNGEMVLVRLQMLSMEQNSGSEYALTELQIQSLLPILKEWKTAAEADENTDAAVFADGINELLTAEQQSWFPQRSTGERPERGGEEAPMRGGDEAPMRGGAQAMFFSTPDLLGQLIETLS